MKLNFTNTVVIGFIVLIIGAVGYKLVDKNKPGEYDAFAQCLTENGAVKYGRNTCPVCQKQKAMFGKSFDLIDYVQCDIDPEACQTEGVDAVPTWKKATGSGMELVQVGFMTFEELAEAYECELPNAQPNNF